MKCTFAQFSLDRPMCRLSVSNLAKCVKATVLCCHIHSRARAETKQLRLTKMLKVQTRKGCLFGVLLVCKEISQRGNLCTVLVACPCINSLGKNPPKAASLQAPRARTCPRNGRWATGNMRHAH